MTEPTATCCFRVLRRMRFPVEANAGDYLAVMPPRFSENLWVLEPVGLWVVRRRSFDQGKLWSTLADLLDDTTLILVHAPGRALLVHLVSSGELTPDQALRVLRSA